MDSNQALAQLQQQQASAKDPNTILNEQRNTLGVNNARDTVTGLRGAIDNTTKLLKQVAPGVMGRTQNSLVTAGQANRIIQNEQAPISATLEDQGQQYGRANEDYTRLEDQASKAASGIYQGQQDRMSYLDNIYKLLYSKEQDAAETARQERAYRDSLISSRSGGSGGGSSKSSAANTKAAVQAHVTQALAQNSGKDGYVSRATFGAALNDWQAAGGTVRDFWKQYGRYANTKTKSQYPGYNQR